MATPYDLVALGTVGTTQHEARSRFRGRPVLVTAQRQTSGRGRTGASWAHAPRAIAASLAFAPEGPAERVAVIPLVAGLAARDALGPGVRLEWPNDLVAGGRKVGGILVEADGPVVTVGLGVNLFWPDPIEGAGALLGSDPGTDAPDWIAEQWAAGLLDRLAAAKADWGRDEYAAACSTIGAEITWEPGGRGVARGVDAAGGLEVESDGGVDVLRSGAVRRVRPVA